MRLNQGRIAIAALLLAASGGLQVSADAGAEDPAYSVEIEPGVSPRMKASEVVELFPAKDQAKVLSLECMSKQTFLSRYSGPAVPVFDSKTVWVVRVKVPFFRPHYNSPPTSSKITTHIIDDENGGGLGTGTGFWPDPD
jgi:hypothetical protein